jgi:hypothetical protein
MIDGGKVEKLAGCEVVEMSCQLFKARFDTFDPHLLVAPDRDNVLIGTSTLLVTSFQPDIYGDKFTARFMQGCRRDNPCICLTNVPRQ